MMAGPEPDMRAEQTYFELLPKATAFAIVGDELTLTGPGDTSLIYTRSEATPSP
jgi:hypothetical protein